MKTPPYLFAALVALVALALCLSSAHGAPPAEINIHGQIVGADGTPLTGMRAYSVTFYDAETDGNLLGTVQTGMTTLSSQGLFNLSITPPAEILGAGSVWYALGVDKDEPADGSAADDVFPGRIQVLSVPFAMQAEEVIQVDADRVGTGSVDNTEFGMLDNATSNLQAQIDAIDTSGTGTNATAIAANSDDIMQNTSDIATNSTNIATNTSNIALKANSADVYTQTAANTRFVDAAGDTMSGALAVGTINEATADAGVAVDGVTLKDGYVALSAGAAPGDTVGKLYNVGGSLFFNGVAVDATTIDKDAINNAGTLGFSWLDAELSNALTIQGGSVNNDSFSALSDLTAESAIGTGSGQLAAGNHGHTLSALSGSVTDGQVPNALTIQGGTVNNDSFSALSDLTAESAIGTGSGQVAAGNHGHTLSALSGSVTDAQVPNALTIQGGSVNNDSFSAISDLSTEMAIGTGSSQVAAGNHGHTLSALSGAVTDAQVPNDITITEADTLASVTGRGASTSTALTFSGGIASNTIGEVTADMGVSADGVLMKDSFVELSNISAPATTTNRLYATGGALQWNGAPVTPTSQPETVDTIMNLVSTADFTIFSDAAYGIGFGPTFTYPRYTRFKNFPDAKVITEIQAYHFENTALPLDGTFTTRLTVEIVEIATGTANHTVATYDHSDPLNAAGEWGTLTLAGPEADRTVEVGEYIRVTISEPSVGTATTGQVLLSMRLTVE